MIHVTERLTISTSDNLDIERTYMDTPTVTEGPEKSWMGRRGGNSFLSISPSFQNMFKVDITASQALGQFTKGPHLVYVPSFPCWLSDDRWTQEAKRHKGAGKWNNGWTGQKANTKCCPLFSMGKVEGKQRQKTKVLVYLGICQLNEWIFVEITCRLLNETEYS